MKPKIKDLKVQVNTDLCRIVQEESNLKIYKQAIQTPSSEKPKKKKKKSRNHRKPSEDDDSNLGISSKYDIKYGPPTRGNDVIPGSSTRDNDITTGSSNRHYVNPVLSKGMDNIPVNFVDESDSDGILISAIDDVPRHRVEKNQRNPTGHESSKDSSNDEESWATKAGRHRPEAKRPPPESPPMIIFGKKEAKKYKMHRKKLKTALKKPFIGSATKWRCGKYVSMYGGRTKRKVIIV